MWRKKRTISTSKSTTTSLMKPSLSFANKNRTKPISTSENNGSSDLDHSKHRCPSITNLLSLGGVVDVDDSASTQRTINIDKDEEDEENYCSKDRLTPNNNGKDIGLALDVIYDRTHNAFLGSEYDEDEEFEDSYIGNRIPTIMNNDDNNNIDKVTGQPISKLIPLTRRPTESFPSSQTTSGKVTAEAKKKETTTTTTTTTDIMMKLPKSFTYFHTTEDKEKVGSSQHFPTNLHLLLDEAAEKGTHYSHIVSWCSQGKAFQIHDLDAFVQSPLLAQHFGQTNNKSFDSFLRQLQAYDFHRCDKSGMVSHPLFIRGRRSLCYRMSQQKPTTATGYSSSLSLTAAAIDDSTNANDKYEDEDEEVYVVRYNDDGGSPYDYEGNNNNIGLDIDNDSFGSEDDEEEEIDSIEGQQSQEETLLIASKENNNSKTINVHNNNGSCQLTYRAKGTTSAPDLTALSSSNPITSVSSSSQTTTKKDNTKGMITAHDKEEYLVAVSDGSGKHIKRNTMSSTSLVSSIMKKENSTNSLTSLRSSSSSVRFGSVEIHEHSIELGCSVHSLRKGPSVTLGWERTSYEKVESIEDHRKQKEKEPSLSPSPSNDNDNDSTSSSTSSPVFRPRSVEERIDKLLDNGYTLREIRSSLREDSKERTRLKKLAAKQRFRKRIMSLPDFSTFFSSTHK